MAGKSDRKGSGRAGVIIRKYEVVEANHHGGAWKVAYADFVTAMMAFFLLMWLLNATTEDQRKGLADYFSPNNLLSHASSGTGQPFGGHTAFDSGAMVSDRGSVQVLEGKRPVVTDPDDSATNVPANAADDAPTGAAQNDDASAGALGAATAQQKAPDVARAMAPAAASPSAASAVDAAAVAARQTPDTHNAGATATASGSGKYRTPTSAEIKAEREREEKAAFAQAARQIRQAVAEDPALADLAKQLAIDMTPEGLRIQIMDRDKVPMFATGSATPNERARLLLQKVVPVLQRLPQPISIAGYTDAAPFPGPDRTNWELSAERANATRRLLVDAGLPQNRVQSVTGHADRDPLVPSDPLAAANRRIAIVVLRQANRATEGPSAEPAVPSGPR